MAKKKTTEKKRKKKKKMGVFPLILLLIFSLSLAACGYLIYGEIDKELSIKDMETDMQSFMKPAQTTSRPAASSEADNGENDVEEIDISALLEDENAYTFDWDGMLAQSEYVIGWIQVPGIERINYPVVQHPDDNQFFLTHDWKGANQSAGAIFMNRYNTSDFTDMNSVVYGHHMKAGSMFGLLKKFADQTFLDENPYFYIYTPDGRKLTYEILCCSHVKDGSDAYLMHFESPDERMAYYNMMLNNAWSKRDVELNRLDTTMMLSTCNSSAGYYERTVVLGKLIEIDLKGQPENTGME